MKVRKARELFKKHQWLERVILPQIHDYFGNRKKQNEWIEQKVEFISFRPFESLNMDSKGSYSTAKVFGRYELHQFVGYIVFYRYRCYKSEDEKPFGYSLTLGNPTDVESGIKLIIGKLSDGGRIKFDAVVRVTSFGFIGRILMFHSYEVFLFPENWELK